MVLLVTSTSLEVDSFAYSNVNSEQLPSMEYLVGLLCCKVSEEIIAVEDLVIFDPLLFYNSPGEFI